MSYFSGPRANVCQMNGGNRRMASASSSSITRAPPPPPPTTSAQHDDLIKYICESWNKISLEADKCAGSTTSAIKYYCEQDARVPKDFQPFNLEAYWGRREVQKMQQPQHS